MPKTSSSNVVLAVLCNPAILPSGCSLLLIVNEEVAVLKEGLEGD